MVSIKNALLVAALACVTVLAPVNAAAGITKVGTHEPLNVVVPAGESHQETISYPGASYVAVHFASFNIPEGDRVIVHSPGSLVSYEYTGSGRGNGLNGSFHATFIPGETAIVDYVSTGAGEEASGFGFAIDSFARGFNVTSAEKSLCRKDDSKPAKCYNEDPWSASLPLAYQRSQAIARLLIGGEGLCTGWLVGSEGHLFTNHHCITEASQADQVDIEFAAESASCADECQQQLGCKGTVIAEWATFIMNNEEHDWALVKIEGIDLSKYGYLQLREAGPQLGEQIYISQHPQGWAKRIASVLDDGKPAIVSNLTASTSCGTNEVSYKADTESGSSGSPVLASTDNAVIALHHCGGCENTAVNIKFIIDDLNKNSITIKNGFVSSTPASKPTSSPAPGPAPSPSSPAPTHSPTRTPKPTRTRKPKPKRTPKPAPDSSSSCDSLPSKWVCDWWSCSWNSDMETCEAN